MSTQQDSTAVIQNWLTYWRNSLADVESGKGALNADDLKTLSVVGLETFKAGGLPAHSTQLAELFEDEEADTQLVQVVFRPMMHKVRLQHGKKKSALYPDYVAPLLCRLWVNRSGRFVPAAYPVIPRDLLSPLPEDSFTLLAVADQDTFLTKQEPKYWSYDEALTVLEDEDSEFWEDYCAVARGLVALCDRSALKEDFEAQESGYLIKVDAQLGASVHIVGLYDWLSQTKDALPLLTQYTNTTPPPRLPCITNEQSFERRLGHGSTQYPLAPAQRDALGQAMIMNEGEVLAVNGPPGTGKTTFVLSLVASYWVEAALAESEPPLIVAASTNNQAVTNVLEAFEKGFEVTDDPFGGRWLSKLSSYGGYFPARSKESDAAKQYQTASFYKEIEHPDAIKQAETDFLANARLAFANDSLMSVPKVRKCLHDALLTTQQSINQTLAAWQTHSHAADAWFDLAQDPDTLIDEKQTELEALQAQESLIKDDLKQWRQFCADESWWLSLFGFLPVVSRKRQLRRELFIEAHISDKGQDIFRAAGSDSIEQALKQWLSSHEQTRHAHEDDINRLHELKAHYETAKAAFATNWSDLNTEQPIPCSFNELDGALDITVRFKLFQLTTHYWEARWLEDCTETALHKSLQQQAKTGKEKTGLKAVRPRWRRRMKLTPCVVSTLYALPSHMTYQVFEGDNNYRTEYLAQEIDLLIIDEAGQVAPEVAGASISLAKRAVMIGDVSQIKPVVGVAPSVNLGNLLANQLIASNEDYESVQASGHSVVGGSAMHVAQTASRYHYLPKAEPGMYLREHRRCLEPIISFCNDLCYQGLLQPFRSTQAVDSSIPPFAYVHVDGRSERPPSGSRINELEAITIAEWLLNERERLESAHNLPLAKIVGVVSPFKAQSELIKTKCQELGVEVVNQANQITVGTVHALQGAERPIVLFSSVYSRHSDGPFIDQDSSILNVAVSRAKDSFIVFGDMEVITHAAIGTPRALLANYLLKDDANQLMFRVTQARPDLLKLCPQPKTLNNSEEHDQWLKDVLQHAKKQVVIVSPWLSYTKLNEHGFIEAFSIAIQRGVEIILYTDHRFNTYLDKEENAKKARQFDQDCHELRHQGVFVKVVNKVHSKLVMGDETFLCVGSYNWASASRDGDYKHMETSLAYANSHLKEEISIQIDYLESKVLQD